MRRRGSEPCLTGGVCDVAGCEEFCFSWELCCRKHWRKVPEGMKRRIYAAGQRALKGSKSAHGEYLVLCAMVMDYLDGEEEAEPCGSIGGSSSG